MHTTNHILARMAISLGMFLCAAVFYPSEAGAQEMPPYGTSISLSRAKHILAAAQAKAVKNKWNVVIAVTDTAGNLVVLERLDNTQFGSVKVAQQKAYSAAAFRRPTKAFQDILAAGGDGLRILGLDGACPLEGGIPLVDDGKIIGAIGVSGVTSAQDGEIAQAGADALKTPVK